MQRQALSTTKTISRRSHLQKKPTRKPVAGHPMVTLQRSIGNRAVQGLISSRRIQAKLSISTPGDHFEQEADRVADTVMRMSAPGENVATSISQPQISRIQRKCAACEKEAAVVQR